MNETGFRITLAAGVLLAGVLFAFRMKKKGEKHAPVFAAVSAAAGFVAGWLLSKVIFLVLNGLDLLAEYGAGAFFRTGAEEFSFAAYAIGAAAAIAGLARISRGKGLLQGTAAETMDALALPGCLLIAWARMCELYLGQLGLGEMATMGLPEIEEGSLLAFFPVSVADPWGGRLLAVCTLEALAALVIGITCLLPKNRCLPAGQCFEKAVFRLCAVQIFLEIMPIVSAAFYFVHVDQALCAIVVCVLEGVWCVRIRRAGKKVPVAAPVLLVLCLTVNGLTQYFMDKPWQLEGVLPEAAFEWMNENLAQLGFAIMLLTVLGVLWTGRMLRKRLGRTAYRSL